MANIEKADFAVYNEAFGLTPNKKVTNFLWVVAFAINGHL